MSIDLQANTSVASRGSGLGTTSGNGTAVVWHRKSSSAAAGDLILELGMSGSTLRFSVGASDAVDYETGGGAQTPDNAATHADGTWGYYAIVVSGGAWAAYWYDDTGARTTIRASAWMGASTPNYVAIGDTNTIFGTGAQGQYRYLRMWNAALSDADLEAEFAATSAVRTSDLRGDWPLADSTDDSDSSGNGNTLTLSGTIGTSSEEPPIGQVETGTSGGLVVGSETSYVGEGFVGSIEAAATGRADETDTALGLTRRKAKAAQLATETDTALALTAAHARATGLASETDSALALAKLKAKATGLASETETALALVRVKAKPVGLATETDNALAVSAVKTRSTGRADETDTALALGEPAGVGLATETDSALSLARVKAKAVQVATTTETALALTARKVRVCGTAAETDTALNLAFLKARATGTATETDSALGLARGGVVVGRADETDTALALTATKIRACGTAIETDEALALSGSLVVPGAPPVIHGGDDVPDRGHRGWNRKRARLKLHREREFAEQIRDLYRELTGDPRTAAKAEAILAPVIAAVPAAGESEEAREAALEARAEALRARADALEADALQAEIALRLLHRELRDWHEADDLSAIELLLAQVL